MAYTALVRLSASPNVENSCVQNKILVSDLWDNCCVSCYRKRSVSIPCAGIKERADRLLGNLVYFPDLGFS